MSDNRLNHYLDEGWSGEGWKPSELLTIGESIIATHSVRRDEVSRARADQFRADMIKEARRRYRDGFYANPFTKEPVPRQEGRR